MITDKALGVSNVSGGTFYLPGYTTNTEGGLGEYTGYLGFCGNAGCRYIPIHAGVDPYPGFNSLGIYGNIGSGNVTLANVPVAPKIKFSYRTWECDWKSGYDTCYCTYMDNISFCVIDCNRGRSTSLMQCLCIGWKFLTTFSKLGSIACGAQSASLSCRGVSTLWVCNSSCGICFNPSLPSVPKYDRWYCYSGVCCMSLPLAMWCQTITPPPGGPGSAPPGSTVG